MVQVLHALAGSFSRASLPLVSAGPVATCLDGRRRAEPVAFAVEGEGLQAGLFSWWELAEDDISSGGGVEEDVQPPVTCNHCSCHAEIGQPDVASLQGVDTTCSERDGADRVDEGIDKHYGRGAVDEAWVDGL